VTRPRLLYVPMAAAFESESFAALADWAQVESFDAPGVGANRDAEPAGLRGIVDAAVAAIDALGWDRFGIVCDSHAQLAGVEIALRERERVGAIFIGHAAARYTPDGERPAMSPEVFAVGQRLLETDYRSFARAITQMTRGQMSDEVVERWIDLVPYAVAEQLLTELSETQPVLAPRLREVDAPVVLARHRDCVLWTREGFDDAAAALPEARVVVCERIPEQDPAFHDAIREFSAVLGG